MGRIAAKGLQNNLGRQLVVPDGQGVSYLVNENRNESGQNKQAEAQELRLGRDPAEGTPEQRKGQPKDGMDGDGNTENAKIDHGADRRGSWETPQRPRRRKKHGPSDAHDGSP